MSKWRDKIAVNPACELIPPMSAEELATTGKDIKANGLLHPIVFWRDEETKTGDFQFVVHICTSTLCADTYGGT